MTANSKQGFRDSVDPMLDAFIKELLDAGSNPKAASRAQDAVTAAPAEALMAALARTISQASPFERAFFVAALAPALAEALAPALAEALAPAIVTTLSNMASQKKSSQQSASSEGSGKQKGE